MQNEQELKQMIEQESDPKLKMFMSIILEQQEKIQELENTILNHEDTISSLRDMVYQIRGISDY